MNGQRIFLIAFGAVYAGLLIWGAQLRSPYFRPWEHLSTPESGNFLPNRSVEMEAIGDLGFKTAIAELYEPRQVRFTTDRFGFRNPPWLGAPQVVLVGDSFAAGAGLDDGDTLARQLEGRLGVPVYNRAAASLAGPARYLRDRRFFERPPRVVAYCPSQRGLEPRPLSRLPRSRPPQSWPEATDDLLDDLERDHGFRRPFQELYNGARYRVWGSEDVGIFGGESRLRLTVDAQRLHLPPAARGLGGLMALLEVFAAKIASKDVKLVFCPIPDAGNVYPELYAPEERARMARPSHLRRVIDEARARGIETIDLEAAFRQRRRPYLFRRDDSHWNPRGVAIAADAIAPVIAPLLKRAR